MAEDLAFEHINANPAKHGLRYDWETAMKVVPLGWHLPSYAEWKQLLDFVGHDAGKLRAQCYNGRNTYGFTALPSINAHSSWWSSTHVSQKTLCTTLLIDVV